MILTGKATIFAPFDTASLILSLARTKFWALFEETASCMSAIRNAEKAQLKISFTSYAWKNNLCSLEEQFMQSVSQMRLRKENNNNFKDSQLTRSCHFETCYPRSWFPHLVINAKFGQNIQHVSEGCTSARKFVARKEWQINSNWSLVRITKRIFNRSFCLRWQLL